MSNVDPDPAVERLEDHAASPHAVVFADRPRVVKLELSAGESVPRHRHPESDVVIHVVEGEVSVAVGDERHELVTGDLLAFDGEREVSPTAVEDATAVVTLACRNRPRGSDGAGGATPGQHGCRG